MDKSDRQVAPVPAIGVGAVLFDAQQRVLVIRRGQPPKQGFWSIPGGRQEPGERLVDCCRREVLEETGMAITPGPIIAVVERVVEGFHYVIIDFLAELLDAGSPDLQPADDVTEARWVDLSALRDYALVPGLENVIRAGMAVREGKPAGALVDVVGDGGDFVAGGGL